LIESFLDFSQTSVKMIIYLQDQKNVKPLDNGVSGFFTFYVSKRTFLILEKTKTKKKVVFGSILVFLYGYFVQLRWSWGAFWYFSSFVFNFLIKKLLARVPHVSASRWCPCQLGGMGDTTLLPNLAIRSILRCAIVFSFT